MREFVRVYEVGPRDGLQNEAVMVSTADKVRLIDGLVEAGLTHIEAASFVHPRAVPQMADADELTRQLLQRYQDDAVVFSSLVLNDKGYDRAVEAGSLHLAFGVAVSDTFSQRNTRMSTAEAFATVERLVQRAKGDGVWVRAYLMTAWVCPFEGPQPPRKAAAYGQRLWDMGIDELAVADTIGHADPLQVGRLLEDVARHTGMEALAVHLHDTQVLGLANATAALSAGVRIFDSSIGGLGGCPFAPGAAGNLATEDIVFLAYKMGLGAGIDLPKLWRVVEFADQIIGRRVGGRIRDWWESHAGEEPAIYGM